MDYLKIEPYKTVLVLNSSYEPINFTNWKRAIILLLKQKAQRLSSRVIRLLNYVKLPLEKMMAQKPSKNLIYKRDDHTCQYCGSKKSLTIDHVIPKCRGGGDTWENMVVACAPCNTKKGHNLLEHTSMKLLRKPKAPPNKIIFDIHQSQVSEWKEYCYE